MPHSLDKGTKGIDIPNSFSNTFVEQEGPYPERNKPDMITISIYTQKFTSFSHLREKMRALPKPGKQILLPQIMAAGQKVLP